MAKKAKGRGAGRGASSEAKPGSGASAGSAGGAANAAPAGRTARATLDDASRRTYDVLAKYVKLAETIPKKPADQNTIRNMAATHSVLVKRLMDSEAQLPPGDDSTTRFATTLKTCVKALAADKEEEWRLCHEKAEWITSRTKTLGAMLRAVKQGILKRKNAVKDGAQAPPAKWLRPFVDDGAAGDDDSYEEEGGEEETQDSPDVPVDSDEDQKTSAKKPAAKESEGGGKKENNKGESAAKKPGRPPADDDPRTYSWNDEMQVFGRKLEPNALLEPKCHGGETTLRAEAIPLPVPMPLANTCSPGSPKSQCRVTEITMKT